MAAKKVRLYDHVRRMIASGEIALRNKFSCMLVTSGYVFSPKHRTRSDISGEITGSGYHKGGQRLKTSFEWDEESGDGGIWCDSVEWKNAILSDVCGVVVYQDSGDRPGRDLLLCHVDLGEPCGSCGPFSLEWDEGLLLRCT